MCYVRSSRSLSTAKVSAVAGVDVACSTSVGEWFVCLLTYATCLVVFQVLQHLLGLLRAVSCDPRSKMDAHSLAVVFAPNLIWPPAGSVHVCVCCVFIYLSHVNFRTLSVAVN